MMKFPYFSNYIHVHIDQLEQQIYNTYHDFEQCSLCSDQTLLPYKTKIQETNNPPACPTIKLAGNVILLPCLGVIQLPQQLISLHYQLYQFLHHCLLLHSLQFCLERVCMYTTGTLDERKETRGRRNSLALAMLTRWYTVLFTSITKVRMCIHCKMSRQVVLQFLFTTDHPLLQISI